MNFGFLVLINKYTTHNVYIKMWFELVWNTLQFMDLLNVIRHLIDL